MRNVPLDTVLHIVLSLFAGAAALAVIGLAAWFGPKTLFKALLPQLDLQRELLQGNRAVALFCGLVLAGTLTAAAFVLAAIYNQVLR